VCRYSDAGVDVDCWRYFLMYFVVCAVLWHNKRNNNNNSNMNNKVRYACLRRRASIPVRRRYTSDSSQSLTVWDLHVAWHRPTVTHRGVVTINASAYRRYWPPRHAKSLTSVGGVA